MQIKLLTTSLMVTKWKSLAAKKRAILTALNKGKGANFTALDIEFVYKLKPVVTAKKRIEHKWLDTITTPYFKLGYDFVGLHFSMRDWLAVGLPDTVRGSNPVDNDVLGEFYIRADENTLRGKTRLNQFIQTILHEVSHEYHRGAGLPDITHAYHEKHGDIRGLIASFNWALYRPKLAEFRGLEKTFMQLASKKVEQLKKKIAELTAVKPKYVPDYVRPTALTPLVQRKADAVIAEMARLGHAVRIVEGYRTFERQTDLYNQGRTTPGAVVTRAKAGESLHNYGVSVDLIFRREGYNATDSLWQLLGKVVVMQGFEWGGSAEWIKAGLNDRPHAQYLGGYKLADFQKGKVDYKKFN